MMDLRGTGRSQGCLDHLGRKDARDLARVIEWLARRPWSNGRVGMTGHSYVGSTASVATAQDPDGLVTIVPSVGPASMYDHQFQGGVPFFPQRAYEYLAVARKLPPIGAEPVQGANTGDDFGNSMEETGCGLPSSVPVAGEDQPAGRYGDWHLVRDHAEGAMRADIPVFAVHGVNDNAARVSGARLVPAQAQPARQALARAVGHGSGCCPTRRGIQWTAALHASDALAGRPRREVRHGPQRLRHGPPPARRSPPRPPGHHVGSRQGPVVHRRSPGDGVHGRRGRQARDRACGDAGAGDDGGALDGERLEAGRLQPGRYRLEIHDRAGLPANEVALRLTFFDSGGVAGAG